jgi:hypothetical protein
MEKRKKKRQTDRVIWDSICVDGKIENQDTAGNWWLKEMEVRVECQIKLVSYSVKRKRFVESKGRSILNKQTTAS